MVSLYLGFHAAKMDPRPEDRKDGEIADGAGELGFSRPTPGGRCGVPWRSAVCVFGIGDRRVVAVHHRRRPAHRAVGWIFEYYRGEHAH